MIAENAPAILFIQLAKGLTELEELKLEELQAYTPINQEDANKTKEDIESLYKKINEPNESFGYEGWIPIPLIGSTFIPFLPKDFQSTVLKRVETVGNGVVMSSTMSSSTINIRTKNGDLVNSLVNACHLLYSMKDSFARIAFFSPELVISSGVFLSMARSIIMGQTEEQIISIQVQNNTSQSNVIKKSNLKNKTSLPFKSVTSNTVGRT
ncbi:hypothetical protein [Aliivibrio fischeri]|uniref:Uncharacterized protein n=1 Tax=Aliivibrio fischeri SR5 TaxID=1088719 RepID=A0AAV3EVE3_ALIFS|nr:hypothetical protein [Aliivibrio fischeri]EHN70920.1 hypothetical protein VFSR5_0700 [Aliivibrio fischeri SR5]